MANGDFDFTAGQILTAAQVDDYLMLQAVQKFATSAARDSALTSRKREGMVTYQDDSNSLTAYSGSAWSTIGPVHGALTVVTPITITQSGSVTNTISVGSYMRVGRMITYFFALTCTGAGTASNVVTVGLPVTADAGYVFDSMTLGTGYLADTSATSKVECALVLSSTSTLKFRALSGVVTPAPFLGAAASPFAAALASGDILTGTITYPAGADA